MNTTPFKLKPIFKDYIWGGKKLIKEYGKKCDFDRLAESWEFAVHKDGENFILGGKYDGLKFSEYIKENKESLGNKVKKFDYFPILIKLIDAADNLSVQVHPNDEYALKLEGEYGKTEMWYVIDCCEDASLYYGLKKKISKQEFKESIKNNTILDILNKVPVKKGDVFFIPSGTIHAIGKGILICEIQQNSNTTYRVYDYNRKDKNGKCRELHINKALDVINFKPTKLNNNNKEKKDPNLLVRCDYFTVYKYKIENNLKIKINNESFKTVTVIEGNGILSADNDIININKGDTIFVPAHNGELYINGNCSIIVSMI